MLTALPVPQFSASWTTGAATVPAGHIRPAGVADDRYLAEVRATLAGGGRTVDDHTARLRISRSIAAGRVARLVTLGLVARGRAGVLEVIA